MEERHFWLKLSIIGCVVIVILIGVGAYACSKQPTNDERKTQIKESHEVFANTQNFFIYRFGEYDIGSAFILVDKETRVEYIYTSTGMYTTTTMTVRVDSLGKPILYKGEFPWCYNN